MTTSTVQLKLRGIFLSDDSPENLTNPAGDFISTIFSPVVNFFLYLIGLPSQLFHGLTNFVGDIFSGVGNFFQYLIGYPIGLFQNLIHSVGEIFSDVGNFFRHLLDPVGEFFSTVVSTVSNFFPNLIGWLNKQFHNLVNPIGEFFSTVVTTVSNFFPCLIGWFNQQFHDLKNLADEIVSDVSSFSHYLIDLFDQNFPPETRQRLIAVATPYLITAAVLIILCLCLWLFFGCISSFVVECIGPFTQRLGGGAKLVLSCISSIFVGLCIVVASFFCCVGCCFCCGTGFAGGINMMKKLGIIEKNEYSEEFEHLDEDDEEDPQTSYIWMMKAPGRSSMRLPGAAFHGNGRGYFCDLRGQPSINFLY